MRLIHLGLREIDVIGRDQRQVHLIGQFDMAAFRRGLSLWQTTALAGMALQFDIKPARKGGGQTGEQRARLGHLPGLQEAAQGPVRPPGQADEPGGVTLQILHRDMRQLPVTAQIKAGVQLHQVHIACVALRQQDQRRRRARPLSRLGRVMRKADLAAHDGLQPRALGGH